MSVLWDIWDKCSSFMAFIILIIGVLLLAAALILSCLAGLSYLTGEWDFNDAYRHSKILEIGDCNQMGICFVKLDTGATVKACAPLKGDRPYFPKPDCGVTHTNSAVAVPVIINR